MMLHNDQNLNGELSSNEVPMKCIEMDIQKPVVGAGLTHTEVKI